MAPRLPALLCALACTALSALAQSSARGEASSSPSASRLPAAARAEAAVSNACLVSSGADAGAGSLRAALADPACTSVVIAAGTTVTLQTQLDIVRSVAISCSAAVAAPPDWSSIGGGAAAPPLKCVLDGGGNTRHIYVETTSPGLRLTLKDLTLRNGAALLAFGLEDSAGSIYFRPPGGVLTIEGCTFSNNKALFLGGAIRTKNTADNTLGGIALAIRDSVFEQNSAQFGGAVSVGTQATFELERSVFLRNVAQAENDFSAGGAVSVGGTALKITATTFDANVAGDESGAVDLFSSCPGDFGPSDTYQRTTTAEVSASVLVRNQVGVNPGGGGAVFGGAIGAVGCTYAAPTPGTPLPRTALRLSDTAFDANAALGGDAFGGAVGTAYGVSTLAVASAFDANSDSCSREGALYINLFSSEGNGCADTLSVQAELAPACDAWAPRGLAHEEAGSQAEDTVATCVPLTPAKESAFCCAPSVTATALVCPLAPTVPADSTCAVPQPRVAAASTLKAADAVARLIAAKKGDPLD